MGRLLTVAIFTCAIYLSVNYVECLKNPGRVFSCWPAAAVKFQQFQIEFYFSSRNIRDQKLTYGEAIGKHIDFQPSRRTAVIIHGFAASSQFPNVKELASELLRWGDVNVIVMDWQWGASNLLFYPQNAANTEYASFALKKLFDQLIASTSILAKDWAPVHFIGHSIGAHVAGQAAARLSKKSDFTVFRVTGLDPAEPCFADVNFPLRLSWTNAQFVDVIHTDASTRKVERFGLRDQLGHADFYVNGGSVQPGCPVVPVPLTKEVERTLGLRPQVVLHALGNGACHHSRAFVLFIESLIQARRNKCTFWGHPWLLGTKKAETALILQNKCDQTHCVEMGINAEHYAHSRSAYYVATTGAAPYCNVV